MICLIILAEFEHSKYHIGECRNFVVFLDTCWTSFCLAVSYLWISVRCPRHASSETVVVLVSTSYSGESVVLLLRCNPSMTMECSRCSMSNLHSGRTQKTASFMWTLRFVFFTAPWEWTFGFLELSLTHAQLWALSQTHGAPWRYLCITSFFPVFCI